MKKQIATLLAIALLVMVMASCGTSPAKEEVPAAPATPSTPEVSSPQEPMTEIDELTFRFAMPFTETDPAGKMAEKFKEALEETSGGKITAELYLGGTLGDERAGLESLRTNSNQMAASSLLADATFFAPEYNIFSTPYLVKDCAHARRIMATDVGAEINDYIETQFGIHTLDIMDRGSRELSCNKKVETPADLKGVKLRLPENEVYIKVWSALGATPVAIALTEVYTSLQTGVVAGQENPLATIVANKFYEVQNYCMITNHIVDMYKIQCSADWWNGLSDAQKAAIQEALTIAVDYGNELVATSEADYRATMESAGCTFVEVDTALFKDAAMDTINDLGANYFKDGLMERVLAID